MVSACIFDLNGTVVDDELVMGEAFGAVLRKLGAKAVSPVPHERGIGVAENWPKLLVKYDLATDKTPETLAVLTQDEYLSRLDKVSVMKGFTELIGTLKLRKIVSALATSSSWTVTDAILSHLNLDQYFEAITVGDEVAEKKPSPEIFMLTAEKLYVPTTECVVFEDSAAGIAGAKAAGMMTVGVYHDAVHRGQLKGAAHLIHDFTELSPDTLQ